MCFGRDSNPGRSQSWLGRLHVTLTPPKLGSLKPYLPPSNSLSKYLPCESAHPSLTDIEPGVTAVASSMPTATSTTTVAGQSSSYSTTLKATSAPSAASRLGTLIDGAGRAFVNHDYRLTQSLVDSAFTLLHPPVSVPDALDDYRRRWDIFRITLEAHVYTSSSTSDDLPPHLKDLLLQSSQSLATAMYQRSLTLFTPLNGSSKTLATFNVIYIPPPVINTLVYATIKLNSPDVGRVVIEEWLARRDVYTSPAQSEAYKKLLAIYCLQILPALDQWDYAKEFLDYESELSPKSLEVRRTSNPVIALNCLSVY